MGGAGSQDMAEPVSPTGSEMAEGAGTVVAATAESEQPLPLVTASPPAAGAAGGEAGDQTAAPPGVALAAEVGGSSPVPSNRAQPAETAKVELASPLAAAPEAVKGNQTPSAGSRKKPAVPAAALIQKKAPRRGIRLKTDADDGPGYD